MESDIKNQKDVPAETEDSKPESYDLPWYHRLIVKCIQRGGPVPNHIAFIMDGNRRHAKRQSAKPIVGHTQGFDTLINVLSWAKQLGVREITVYAFSIENFNRSFDEVDGLLNLARDKIPLVLRESHQLMRLGVRVRVIGCRDLMPPDLRDKFAQLELSTKYNSEAVLNVCFAYTSTQEICHAVKSIPADVTKVTSELLDSHLYTADCSRVDLVVRTSGEVRLSDFLLWQSRFSPLCFCSPLWPTFSIWDLYAAVRFYQNNFQHLSKLRSHLELNHSDSHQFRLS